MKILIVDDEQPARERLRQLVEDFPDHEVVGEAGNGEQAIALAASLAPEIVLLDIRMPGIDGLETAQHLNALEQPPAVVFTTAYDEYAIAAFDVHAIGYVLKPVRRARLESALEHAARVTGRMLDSLKTESTLGRQRQHLCARLHGELRLIALDAVACCMADQKYVCVYHDGGRDLIDDSLKSLEEEFVDRFVRIHRSALVAVNRIDRLEKTDDGRTRIVLREHPSAAGELIVSRRHVADVRRRLRGEPRR